MRRLGILAALSCLVVCAAAHAQDAAKADAPPQHPWPGGDRASLEIPDDVWDKVLAGTTPGRRPLGYSGDEMRFFGGRDHLLRTVDNLFRDVRHVPRDTGRITDAMLIRAAKNLAGLVKHPTTERIVPNTFDKGVVGAVARAIR